MSIDTLTAARPAPVGASVAARAQRAWKVYGKGDLSIRALDDLGVEIERGTFTAVMGPPEP